MKPWPLIVLLVPLAATAEVYKWVDEQGNVVYSDQPRPGAKPLDLPEVSTYKSVPPGRAVPRERAAEAAGPMYGVQVLQPEPEATVRDNRGIMDVRVATEPPLLPERGHRLAIQLDDQAVQYTSSLEFQLTEVQRGAHTLRVWVTDKEGEAISDRQAVTFFMHQASRLHPTSPLAPGGGGP